MNDTIHNRSNSGIQLVEVMYTFLTKKNLPPRASVEADPTLDLPAFARPTASKLIKDSMTEAEIKTSKSTQQITKQAESIIEKQKQERNSPTTNKTVQINSNMVTISPIKDIPNRTIATPSSNYSPDKR